MILLYQFEKYALNRLDEKVELYEEEDTKLRNKELINHQDDKEHLLRLIKNQQYIYRERDQQLLEAPTLSLERRSRGNTLP